MGMPQGDVPFAMSNISAADSARWTCPACNSLNLKGRFCANCGAPFRRGAPAVRSERRRLTALFCQFVDTTLLASLDPEEFNDHIRRHYAACAKAIARFDGLIAGFSTDGMLAVFGYPTA